MFQLCATYAKQVEFMSNQELELNKNKNWCHLNGKYLVLRLIFLIIKGIFLRFYETAKYFKLYSKVKIKRLQN